MDDIPGPQFIYASAGKFVADIIYYYGEDNNITALFANKLPDIPSGYNYDFVNSDAINNILSVSKGQIITPEE